MDYFEIGKILKPQGIKGELKIESYLENIDRFNSFSHIYFFRNGSYEEHKIKSSRTPDGFIYVMLEDCRSRNDAELLRNWPVYIHRSQARPLDEDEDYIADLIGLKILDENNRDYGILDDVIDNTTTLVYSVIDSEGGTLMFPLAPGVETERNINEGYIRVDSKRLSEVAIYDKL